MTTVEIRVGATTEAGERTEMRFCALALLMTAIALPCAALAQDDAAARKGAKLYENNCATCHGDELENNSGIAFDLRRLRADEHPRFVNSVLHGKNAMPSWDGKLSPDQIESLWAYIRANAYH
jgi:mono/diheme cytochrome c family protein